MFVRRLKRGLSYQVQAFGLIVTIEKSPSAVVAPAFPIERLT